MTITDYYVTTDAMGSVTAILDEDGNVLERRSYDAFGEMTCLAPDGAPVEESPTGLDVGFQGQIWDEDTGLCQMGYRWHSPVLGRWLSVDVIDLLGGSNCYMSLNNNPADFDDPFGMAAINDIILEDSDKLKNQIDDPRSNSLLIAGSYQIPPLIGKPTKPNILSPDSDWKKYVQGNMSKEAIAVLSDGCSLTVAFHGVMNKQGEYIHGNTRDISLLIKAVITAIKTNRSVDCPCGPKSVTLIPCFSGSNGNARAIADATQLPVVAACSPNGDQMVYPYKKTYNGSIAFYVDTPWLQKSTTEQILAKNDNERRYPFARELAVFSTDKSYRWDVVSPSVSNKLPAKPKLR